MLTRIDKLIEYLKGTCLNLNEACEDFGFDEDDLSISELTILDEAIFQCSCGWWCDVAEKHVDEFGEAYCDDCWESLSDD